ncbi:MAG: hypothetical protein ACI4AM_10030 [Muribaculaceae bacterium]
MKLSAYFAAAALMCAATASAQDLSTEVQVDRTIEPAERAATRPAGLFPQLLLPKTTPVQLNTANYTSLTSVERTFPLLYPQADTRTPVNDGYRGYAMVGYLPTFNVGVTAGYRPILSDRVVLDVYGNFRGESYEPEGLKNSFTGGGIGSDLLFKPNANSTLTANASFALDSHKVQAGVYKQSRTNGQLGAQWTSSVEALDYHARVGVLFNSYGDVSSDWQKANPAFGMSEQLFDFGIGAALPVNDNGDFALDLGYSLLHQNSDTPKLEGEDNSVGIVYVTPAYRLRNGAFSANIGLRVDHATGNGSNLRISPDLRFGWEPAKTFGVEVSFTGEQRLQPMAELSQTVSPYLFATQINNYVAQRLGGELRMRVGPFKGFAIEVFGGYDKVDNYLMPDLYMLHFTASGYEGVTIDPLAAFAPEDIKGWHAGVNFTYTSRLFDANLGVEAAPSDGDEAYYLRRDRAQYVFTAGVQARPIDKLEVGVGYEFRNHRLGYYVYGTEHLGCVSDLTLNASYRLTPQLSLFANLDNLLCRRYQVVPGLLSQSLCGLVGASIRF